MFAKPIRSRPRLPRALCAESISVSTCGQRQLMAAPCWITLAWLECANTFKYKSYIIVRFPFSSRFVQVCERDKTKDFALFLTRWCCVSDEVMLLEFKNMTEHDSIMHDLYVLVTYIPPSGSAYVNRDIFCELEDMLLYVNAEVVGPTCCWWLECEN